MRTILLATALSLAQAQSPTANLPSQGNSPMLSPITPKPGSSPEVNVDIDASGNIRER